MKKIPTLLVLLLAAMPPWLSASGEARDIGNRKQLFIDEAFIEQAKGIVLRMNPPMKHGVVMAGTNSWENGVITGAGSLIEDGGKFRFWYTAMPASQRLLEHTQFRLCYAESIDGIYWTKPNLGQYEWEGSTANNIIMNSEIESGGGVLLDPLAPPAQRYKLLARLAQKSEDQPLGYAPNGTGLYLYTSPDGLRWTINPDRVFPFDPDTVNVVLYDDRTHRYLAYLRTWDGGRRRVGVVEIEDLMKPWPYTKGIEPWLPWKGRIGPPTREIPDAFGADASDPENVDHYTPAAVKYPWADNVYLLFPSAYGHFPPPPKSQFANDGPLDIQLALSRDGRKFHRVSHFPYIEDGLKGSADNGSMYMYVGMIRRGPEIFQYYCGLDWTHGAYHGVPETRNRGSMMLVRQRLDGFVSAEADESGGEFVTPELVFKGQRLTLNVNASATGQVLVELRGADRMAITGYAFGDSDFLGQNDIAKVVTWQGKSDVSALAGRVVRVAFKLRTAKLYAFQFVD